MDEPRYVTVENPVNLMNVEIKIKIAKKTTKIFCEGIFMLIEALLLLG